jgi:hypothetical protein
MQLSMARPIGILSLVFCTLVMSQPGVAETLGAP